MAVFIVLGITFPGLLSGMDLSICQGDVPDIETRIRCSLWTLTGLMRPLDDSGGLRGTGTVSIRQGRRVQAGISVENLKSPWPPEIRLRFFEGLLSNQRITEEIIDNGLNGLDPLDPKDAYLRYHNGESPINILADLDPNLKQPLNEDYLAKLDELLDVLERRPPPSGEPAWKELEPGLEMARILANRYIRLGDNVIIVLRIDPRKFDIVPFSFWEMDEADQKPLAISGWADIKPRSVALFNAGQYYPDYRYMGLLFKDGISLGTEQHGSWSAVFLSGGQKNGQNPRMRIADLEMEKFDARDIKYRYAAQSFMLIDRTNRIRVRQTDHLASRTVLAEDDKDRILVVFVRGGCTLHELAELLISSGLGIRQAMCLDGGFESQMFIRNNPANQYFYGAWVVNDRRQYHNPSLRIPLPTVFAVVPRDSSTTDPIKQ